MKVIYASFNHECMNFNSPYINYEKWMYLFYNHLTYVWIDIFKIYSKVLSIEKSEVFFFVRIVLYKAKSIFSYKVKILNNGQNKLRIIFHIYFFLINTFGEIF